jgi:RNA polymerase sigma factor (sigma-70 family)
VEYEDVFVRQELLEARRRQLRHAINGLPEPLQTVAELHFAQLSNPEIAEILDISIGNVAQRICQAKKRIKASI